MSEIAWKGRCKMRFFGQTAAECSLLAIAKLLVISHIRMYGAVN